MLKIIKTSSPQWLGNGFGVSSAVWAVEAKPEIRIKRESGLWIAVGGGAGRMAEPSKQALELRLTSKFASY